MWTLLVIAAAASIAFGLIAVRLAIIDEPPTLTSGNGMPVIGASPIVIPTFTNTWKRNATATLSILA